MENKIPEIRKTSSAETIKIPGWDDFKDGEYIRIKTEEELVGEFGSLENVPREPKIIDKLLNIGKGWPKEWCEKYSGKVFRAPNGFTSMCSSFTIETLERTAYLMPSEELGIIISFPISVITPLRDRTKKKNTKKSSKVFSIRETPHKQEIIDEMISKVSHADFEALIKCNIQMPNSKIKNGVVDSYLEQWAESKYEFYLMFGKNLSVKKQYNMEMRADTFTEICGDFIRKFPEHREILRSISMDEYKSNTLRSNNIKQRYPDEFISGMKVSKFLSRVLKNKTLDIEYSKVLQNIHEKGFIFWSIDPIDFLTMSTNKHTWTSCQRIMGGDWSGAGFSLMLDDVSTISYICSSEIFSYSNYPVPFMANSKRWRQQVQVCKDNCMLMFNRDYPVGSASDDLKNNVRAFIEETISNYAGADNDWNIFPPTNSSAWVNAHNSFHYTDRPNHIAFLKGYAVGDKFKFDVGSEDGIWCPICGKRYTRKHNGKIICCNCS